MASRVISRAIQEGVPAYNCGQVGQCALIYEEAAGQLLRTWAAEVKPEVKTALESCLARAAASRSKQGASERDAALEAEVAWAFRRAFDQQLSAESARPKQVERAAPASSDVKHLIRQAIAEGAPAYNRGSISECADLYAATAESILDGMDLEPSVQQHLSRALIESRRLPDAKSRAWALRRAFDAVLQDNVGHAIAAVGRIGSSIKIDGNGPSAGLVRNFVRGEGLDLKASVINDTVMGGSSQSTVHSTPDGILFEGNVTRRGGGGFASVRFQPADAASFTAMLRGASGVTVRIGRARGCLGWKLQLNETAGWFSRVATQWQADFQTTETGSSVRIPFSTLVPTTYGKPTGSRGLSADAIDSISGFGFMLSFLAADGSGSQTFSEGAFALVIVSVEVY